MTITYVSPNAGTLLKFEMPEHELSLRQLKTYLCNKQSFYMFKLQLAVLNCLLT